MKNTKNPSAPSMVAVTQSRAAYDPAQIQNTHLDQVSALPAYAASLNEADLHARVQQILGSVYPVTAAQASSLHWIAHRRADLVALDRQRIVAEVLPDGVIWAVPINLARPVLVADHRRLWRSPFAPDQEFALLEEAVHWHCARKHLMTPAPLSIHGWPHEDAKVPAYLSLPTMSGQDIGFVVRRFTMRDPSASQIILRGTNDHEQFRVPCGLMLAARLIDGYCGPNHPDLLAAISESTEFTVTPEHYHSLLRLLRDRGLVESLFTVGFIVVIEMNGQLMITRNPPIS